MSKQANTDIQRVERQRYGQKNRQELRRTEGRKRQTNRPFNKKGETPFLLKPSQVRNE